MAISTPYLLAIQQQDWPMEIHLALPVHQKGHAQDHILVDLAYNKHLSCFNCSKPHIQLYDAVEGQPGSVCQQAMFRVLFLL